MKCLNKKYKKNWPDIKDIESTLIDFIDPSELKKGYSYLDIAHAIYNLIEKYDI